jgi:NAD(P)-dependent dehydrogenase (short-subunit alcohol dehydrogenase family)
LLNQDSLVVVAGGSGLIGSAIVNALRVQDSKVIVLDKVSSKSDYKASGEVLLPDKLTEDIIVECVQSIYNHFGQVTGLINCIATRTKSSEKFFSSFDDYDLDTWNEVLHGNLTQSFLINREFAKRMRDFGKGSIVNFSSIYGAEFGPDLRIYKEGLADRPMTTPVSYAVSKAGVVGLTKFLASTFAPYGVRVNSISPGGVIDGQPNAFVEAYSDRVPMGRMARVEELAGLPIFLVSDEASYITGQNIYVDGGLSAW